MYAVKLYDEVHQYNPFQGLKDLSSLQPDQKEPRIYF